VTLNIQTGISGRRAFPYGNVLLSIVFSRLNHRLFAAVFVVASPSLATAASMSAEIGFLHVEASVPGERFSGQSSDFPEPYYDVVAHGGGGFQEAVYFPTITATFNPRLSAPGTTVVHFQPPSGRYQYEFSMGFSAELGIREPVHLSIEEGLSSTMDIAGVTGFLPHRKSDSDSDTLGVPFGIPFVAAISFGYTQDWREELSINSLRANVFARHRETGTTRIGLVVLQGGANVPIELNLPGVWDFSLARFVVEAAIDREITVGAGIGIDYLIGSDDVLFIPPREQTLAFPLRWSPFSDRKADFGTGSRSMWSRSPLPG
jgi:hypothetical protein